MEFFTVLYLVGLVWFTVIFWMFEKDFRTAFEDTHQQEIDYSTFIFITLFLWPIPAFYLYKNTFFKD